MSAIGGYFQLEKFQREDYHSDLIKLNTARNSFEYILEARGIKKVYLPYYTCYVMLDPLKKMGIEYQFYRIDRNLRPVVDFCAEDDEAVVVNNYFGLRGEIDQEIRKFKNIIMDSTQGFFQRPLKGIDTIYSCRKFLGVSDGAYLSTDKILERELEEDFSGERYLYLLKRFEGEPEEYYNIYLEVEEKLYHQPIRKMSRVTENFLRGFDYEKIMRTREENYRYLHERLGKYNELELELSGVPGPMFYPFFFRREGLREKLLKNRIYMPTYWREVLEKVERESFEAELVNYLIPLPVDQRYGREHMEKIVEILEREIGEER
ncbi:MAG: hypothetical protein ACRDB2_06605 [Fusobacteriaceae bacterium]